MNELKLNTKLRERGLLGVNFEGRSRQIENRKLQTKCTISFDTHQAIHKQNIHQLLHSSHSCCQKYLTQLVIKIFDLNDRQEAAGIDWVMAACSGHWSLCLAATAPLTAATDRSIHG